MANFVTPIGRQPRGLVKINGMILTGGWLEFSVENNNYYSADTFSIKLAGAVLDASAAQAQADSPNACALQMDTNWFLSSQDMFVELFIGIPKDPNNYSAAELISWIYGQVDDIHYDPAENIITLEGRDLTRVFIDTKTTMKWSNLTSSQIVALLATKHGMKAVIPAPTTTKAGKFYEIDHVNVLDERSEWDILNFLANADGYVVFVRGTSLYFQPKPDPKTATPYQLVWKPATKTTTVSANMVRIGMKRALTVSRGIQVEIKSWNKKHAKGYVVRYPATAKTISVGKSKIGDGAQIYSKVVPNLEKEAAIKQAQNWYAQIVAHELKIDVDMSGDNELDVTSIISLSGTKTAFDQTYFPDSIHRNMSMSEGYSMSFSAKNHSPDSAIGVL